MSDALLIAIATTVGAVLTAALGTPLWSRRISRRLTDAQASATETESYVLVTRTAVELWKGYAEAAHDQLGELREEFDEFRAQMRIGHDAREAHIEALRRQILNGDPPPPVAPPIPY